MRVAHNVNAHQGFCGVLQDAFQRPVGSGLHGSVDFFFGGFALQFNGYVRGGTGEYGDTHGVSVQFSFQFRKHQGHGFGRSGGGGDDAVGSGTSAAQVAVGSVLQALVAGVGVYGGHEALLLAKVLVHDLHHRCQAIGGAGSVGDDGVLGRQLVVVHAQNDGFYAAFGRGRQRYFFGSCFQVLAQAFGIGEEAGGFNDYVNAQLAPRQLRGVFDGRYLNGFSVDDQAVFRVLHRSLELSVGGVVLQQMGQNLRFGEVVDGDYFQAVVGNQVAEGQAADAAKSIDGNFFHAFCS